MEFTIPAIASDMVTAKFFDHRPTYTPRNMHAATWNQESDAVAFTYKNVPCFCLRVPHSFIWCGYICVDIKRIQLRGIRDVFDTWEVSEAFNVHGGVTLSEDFYEFRGDFFKRACDVHPQFESWFSKVKKGSLCVGFDCGHSFDYQPMMMQHLHDVDAPLEGIMRGSIYRDLPYVIDETINMAKQYLEEE